MQIGAKVYASDTFETFVRRIVYVLEADETKAVSLLPISKIVSDDAPAFTEVPSDSQSTAAGPKAAKECIDEEEGACNRFDQADLVKELGALEASEVYYVVYLRPKTKSELVSDAADLD